MAVPLAILSPHRIVGLDEINKINNHNSPLYRSQRHFHETDKNKDGVISREEWNSFYTNRFPEHRITY